MIPWLWSAPEIVTAKSRKDRKFSHKSDVWSFGKENQTYIEILVFLIFFGRNYNVGNFLLRREPIQRVQH